MKNNILVCYIFGRNRKKERLKKEGGRKNVNFNLFFQKYLIDEKIFDTWKKVREQKKKHTFFWQTNWGLILPYFVRTCQPQPPSIFRINHSQSRRCTFLGQSEDAATKNIISNMFQLDSAAEPQNLLNFKLKEKR